MIYLICLDGSSHGESGDRIARWVGKTYGERHARPLSNSWVVDGPLGGEQIETGLMPLLRPDDRLLIVKAGTEALWHGVDVEEARWLAGVFPGSVTERIPGKTEGLA